MLSNHQQIDWPCELSLKTQEQLRSIATLTTDIGKIGIPPQSSKFNGIAYIKKGIGYLSMLNYDFNSSYGIVVGKSDWVGAVSIGDFDTSMVKAEEIEVMEVIFFDRRDVERLAKKNNEIYLWLFAITKAFTKKWANNFSYQSCKSALRVLFTLTEVASYSTIDVRGYPCIRANQKQLGDICQVSRSRVNETIQKYKRMAYLETSRENIHISNFDKLFLEAKGNGYEPIA